MGGESGSIKRQVLVFGKTGDGKSTTSTMLVDGNLDNPTFPFGSGVKPVTKECKTREGRGNFVVDTVGLGEDKRTNKTVTDIIYKFLNEVKQRQYSHLLFVKEAGRVDGLDLLIWKTFLKVFKGAEKAMVVVFAVKDISEEPADWIKVNRELLEATYDLKGGLTNRFVGVRFPRIQKNARLEKEFAKMRTESLHELEEHLDTVFAENSPVGKFFEAEFQQLPDGKLREFAADVWEFIYRTAQELKVSIQELVEALRLWWYGPKGDDVVLGASLLAAPGEPTPRSSSHGWNGSR